MPRKYKFDSHLPNVKTIFFKNNPKFACQAPTTARKRQTPYKQRRFLPKNRGIVDLSKLLFLNQKFKKAANGKRRAQPFHFNHKKGKLSPLDPVFTRKSFVFR